MTKPITSLILLISLFFIPQLCFAGIDFDGSDDYVCKENPTALLSNDPMTVTAWIYPDSATGIHRICGHIETTGVDTGWSFGTNDDELRFTTHSVKDYNTTTFTVVSEEWQFIAASMQADHDVIFYHYCGSSLTIQEITYTADMNAPDSTADLSIGSINSGDTCAGSKIQYFNGQITEVAIWNTALSATDIEILYKSKIKGMPLQIKPANLVAYWPMNSGRDGTSADGDTIYDRSGNGNNGTGDDGAGEGLTWKGEEVLSYPE